MSKIFEHFFSPLNCQLHDRSKINAKLILKSNINQSLIELVTKKCAEAKANGLFGSSCQVLTETEA